VTSVIMGAKTVAQLQDNIGATKVVLSEKDLKALDEVSQLPQEYPGWMLTLQGQYRAKPPVKE
jgi:aryl-alcohol dehydrogenase-like predicted oxidoreductase